MKLTHYLLKHLLLSWLLIFLLRVLFYFFNLDYFSELTFLMILKSLFIGIRFDIATVATMNIPFILISLIPLKAKFFEYLRKWSFFIPNALLIGTCIVDLEFFPFIGKRMTMNLTSMGGDIQDQISQLALYYWHVTFMVVGNAILLWKFTNKRSLITRGSFWTQGLLSVAVLILTAIAVRGGVQMKPLSTKAAFVGEHHAMGNLILNTAYTMMRSMEVRSLNRVNLVSKQEMRNLIKQEPYNSDFKGMKNQNIVILIMESFAQEYFEEGYMPFLLELSKKSAFFPYNFANGRRSVDAVPSILSGHPAFFYDPIVFTEMQINKTYSLASELKKEGYSTAFYHGGVKGTMEFDSYTRSIGVDRYESSNSYPLKDKHFDGAWGIYDHHYLQYMKSELDKEQGKFLSVFFSLSSHQPYSIPKELQKQFPAGTLEIHQSIRYADWSLRQFFESAKKSDWFNDTLFIITADHTQHRHNPKFQNMLGRYRVPLFIYHPQMKLFESVNANKVTQQIDIMPTVFDFLDIEPQKRVYLGESVFKKSPGKAFIYADYSYHLIQANNIISLSQDKLSKRSSEFIPGEEIVNNYDSQYLKAATQYFINGMIDNNLYDSLSPSVE